MERTATHRLIVVTAVMTFLSEVEELLRRDGLKFELTRLSSLDELDDGDPSAEAGDILFLHCDGLRPGQFERFRRNSSLPVVLLVDGDCADGLQLAIDEGADPWVLDLDGPRVGHLLKGFIQCGTDSRRRGFGDRDGMIPFENNYHRTLLDWLPHGIWELDRDGRIVFVNRAYANMLGIEPDELVGRYVWEATAVAEEAQRLREAYENVLLDEPEPTPYVARTRAADGRLIDVKIDWSYKRDRAGRLQGFVAVHTNITEQRRAERQARERLDQLAHMGRLNILGEMASGMAHEVSQPITAIANLARACRHSLDKSPEELGSMLAQVVDQAERASRIIRQLRHFVRRGERRRGPVDLHEAVVEVIELMRADHRAECVAIEFDVPRDLPPIWGDFIQIQQVICNLVCNALDVLEQVDGRAGRIDVSAKRIGDSVAVAVVDNGPGLSDVAAQRLFEPFFTTKREGLGLGLSISRSIVEDHEGQLDLLTGMDAGGAFQFTLPVAENAEGSASS